MCTRSLVDESPSGLVLGKDIFRKCVRMFERMPHTLELLIVELPLPPPLQLLPAGVHGHVSSND